MSQETNNQKTALQEQSQLFIVDGGLLQSVANYLALRPYAEVAGLIDGLKQAKPVSIRPEGESKTSASKLEKLEK